MEELISLKKKVKNNRLQSQKDEESLAYDHFSFFTGATEDEISKLPSEVTEDIKAFLRENNGARLFYDPLYGGGYELFSIDEIIELLVIWECPINFLPIGFGPNGEWIVYEMHGENKKRMWIGESINFEENLDATAFDFMDWLDYLILLKGAPYWTWDKAVQ